MNRYLLDTNTISFFVRQQSFAVMYRMRAAPTSSLGLSVIAEAELRFGLERLPPEARARMATEKLLRTVRIYPWDSDCAATYGRCRSRQQQLGKPLAAMDMLIASHAIALDAVLVSNDAAFLHVAGLRVEDWTKGPEPA